MIATQTWLTYADLLTFLKESPKLKIREQFEKNGYVCQWFAYAQLIDLN